MILRSLWLQGSKTLRFTKYKCKIGPSNKLEWLKEILKSNYSVVSPHREIGNYTRCLYSTSDFKTKEMADGWKKVKESYLNMPLEEKRLQYKCGKKYSQVENLIRWNQYACNNSGQLPALTEEESKGKLKVDEVLNQKVAFWEGNITALEIDSIVNAANNSLLGGGGVDGAIHSAAGKYLLEECKSLRGCETGEAKIAGGYQLPAKHVILTVGPRGEKPVKLESCYTHSLHLMIENSLKTTAFPCISTGVYGYPNEKAAHVCLRSVRHFLENHRDEVDLVVFCLFLPTDVAIYERLLQQYFPVK